jgi:4-amino-4-deoxy-L-arabinose transferase-like glycosyltransferase
VNQADTPTISTAARIGWTVLILATLYICYFSHLSAIGFVGPDEPRYAWIARDMAESGDWVTPRLYGKPWFEKPILYYWSAAIFFKLSDVQQNPSASPTPPNSNATPRLSPEPPATAPPISNANLRFSPETAARLPSAIYALLATLALAWLALRIYGPETARWFLLLLPTTVGMIGFSHAAATDMPFSATLTIAMVFAAILLRLIPNPDYSASPSSAIPQTVISNGAPAPFAGAPGEISPPVSKQPSHLCFYVALLLFGFFLGLAVLAKGPAAIILTGGAVFFWALFTKRWRDAFRLLHPVAIVSFCLTALPWYIVCARRNPDFFRVFIIEHNFKRYLTPEFQHIQPFWYYVPVLLLAFLPWLALLLWSIFAGARHLLQKKPLSPATLFLLTWAAFCILFFSTSHSKLPGYILPAIPAVALLLSRYLTQNVLDNAATKRWLPRCLGATLFTASYGVAKFGWQIRFVTDIYPAPTASLWALILFVAGAVVSLLGIRRHTKLAFVAIPLTVFLLLNAGNDSYWQLDEGVSARPALRLLNYEWNPAEINSATIYKLPRGLQYGLNFYLRRELQEWTPETGGRSLILTNFRGTLELRRRNIPCLHYIAFPAVTVCGIPSTNLTASPAP